MFKNRSTLMYIVLLAVGAVTLCLANIREAKSEQSDYPLVTVIDVDDMIINPIAYEIISDGIKRAQNNQSECLILRMDTPGGLMETTHKIVKDIMNSPVPVVTYVWPQGGRAASAGVFITLCSHFAAMAESTHIGAAHPVIMDKSWGSIDSVMQEKIINDARAWIETLAKNRNRNVEWAKEAVTESVSITEKEAFKINVIDFIAPDLDDLLVKLNGQKVQIGDKELTLNTKGANVEYVKLSARQRFLNHLINPNIAYILMLVGFFGLIYEVTHPGFGFPGIAGIICLLLAFYALQVLPTNYAGLALIILGVTFFIVEAFTPTFGTFTLAGIIALVFGSTILFNQPYQFLKVSLKIVLPFAITLGVISTFLATRVIQSHRKKAITGREAIIGAIGTAQTEILPGQEGQIFVHGEIWIVESKDKIAKGEKILVEKMDGLKLTVKKLS